MELLYNLRAYIPLTAIFDCRLVCKSWNDFFTNDDTLWRIYFSQNLCEELLPYKVKVSAIATPSNFLWFFACQKLEYVTKDKNLQKIISDSDRDTFNSISVLWYLPICRAYTHLPDKLFLEHDPNFKVNFTRKDIVSIIIRHNLSMMEIPDQLAEASKIARKLTNNEVLTIITTILGNKLRAQFLTLHQQFQYITGEMNMDKLSLDFLSQYPDIFIIFSAGKCKGEKAWIILRSQVEYVVTDQQSLVEIVCKILKKFPNGIRIEAFRKNFERKVGLPFGVVCNKSLDKFLNVNAHLFTLRENKIFLEPIE